MRSTNKNKKDFLYLFLCNIDSYVFGFLFLFLFVLYLVVSTSLSLAAPIPAGGIYITSNETSTTPPVISINISGGRIATINLTTEAQNPRWKAFVGNVTGSFSLDDASGSTIYDWSLTTVSGEIYATRNSSSITWASVNCSNTTFLETENYLMNHTNPTDNITRTFNYGLNGTHEPFYITTVPIINSSCPTLNTYVNNATQDASFEEIVLYESAGGNTIYATIMETESTGFDGRPYDFQMIVPEYGILGYTGATAYYLYVEIT